MTDIHNDCNSSGDDKARFLIERGDMGHRPGEKFPYVGGNSERALVWRAVMGGSLSEHEGAMEYERAQANRNRAIGFRYKVGAQRKIGAWREHLRRMHEITEVSFDDPFVLQRDIKAQEFVNLYSGVAFANSLGVVFNVHLTISWELLGYGKGDGLNPESPLNRSFVKQYTEWCADNHTGCDWIYSNEFGKSLGYHTHFMTSVRPDLLERFKAYLVKRMRRINHCEELNERAFRITVNKRGSVKRQWIVFQYLCKGIDQDATMMHVNGCESIRVAELTRFRYENPGNLHHKMRCGLSANIRQAARAKHGFQSLMEKGQLNVDLLYADTRPRELIDAEIHERELRDLALFGFNT